MELAVPRAHTNITTSKSNTLSNLIVSKNDEYMVQKS